MRPYHSQSVFTDDILHTCSVCRKFVVNRHKPHGCLLFQDWFSPGASSCFWRCRLWKWNGQAGVFVFSETFFESCSFIYEYSRKFWI